MSGDRKQGEPWRWKAARKLVHEQIPFECKAFHQEERDRRLLIFIDGTNNDPAVQDPGKQTNIFRLSKLVDERPDPADAAQRAIYHEGVGSKTDDPNPFSAVLRHVGGKGVDRILNQVYLDTVEEYRPGDRFFLFGFSRGAAVARMLANRLLEDGIPEKGLALYHRYSRLGQIEGQSTLKLDKVVPEGPNRRAIDEIELLGLFDAVASIGLMERLFEPAPKLGVPPGVRKTYHLVSIDENRVGFAPTLVDAAGDVEEIWFPGVHSDVGGSYPEAGLANVALHFMLNRLRDDHGIRFKEVPECPVCSGHASYAECEAPDCHVANWRAKAHRHSRWWPKRRRKIRALPGQLPRVHHSALARLDDSRLEPPYRPAELLALRTAGKLVRESRD